MPPLTADVSPCIAPPAELVIRVNASPLLRGSVQSCVGKVHLGLIYWMLTNSRTEAEEREIYAPNYLPVLLKYVFIQVNCTKLFCRLT